MEIRKLLYNAVIFLLISLSVFAALFYMLFKIKKGDTGIIYRTSGIYYWKGGNTYQKFKDFDEKNKYDVIVIGSSHAYRGYDPRIFKRSGISLFNLGTSAQTPLNSYWIAKNCIHLKHKLVIFDVDDGALSTDGFEASADLIQNISSDKAAFQMATCYDNPQVANMLFLRMLNEKKPAVYIDSFYVGNGYSQKMDSLKVRLPLADYNYNPTPDKTQIDYLERIIQYFKANQIPVILVTHPSPLERNRIIHASFLNILNKICEKYQIDYLDYSSVYNFDSQNCFFDSNHLNQNGVEKFNSILIKDLYKRAYL
jgi:hypothetical protein